MASYDREVNKFSSTAVAVRCVMVKPMCSSLTGLIVVQAETRLRQSLVFGNQVVQPNYLSTAVAFQVLGEVTHVFGRFKPLMELIVGILSKAVYKTDPLLPQAPFDPSDPAQLHKYEDDVLRAYFKATPFFVEYERKEAELERMGQMLQSITEQFEKSGAHNLGGRLKGLVSQWAQDARQAKLRGQLGELSAQLKVRIELGCAATCTWWRSQCRMIADFRTLTKRTALFTEI